MLVDKFPSIIHLLLYFYMINRHEMLIVKFVLDIHGFRPIFVLRLLQNALAVIIGQMSNISPVDVSTLAIKLLPTYEISICFNGRRTKVLA